MNNFGEKVSFIWSVADLLRGPYRPNQYKDVMLPMTVLRRLDCVLEPTKDKVHAKLKSLEGGKVKNVEPLLCRVTGVPFYNTSRYTFERLKGDPNNIAANLTNYIKGFSGRAREIIEHFGFEEHIAKLDKADRLFLLVSKFCEIDLHPDRVSNIEMGYIFEELIRRFNEASNEEAGDHFTPREVIRLMVNLIFLPDGEILTTKGIVKTLYDPACGTGGMLSVAEEYVRELNPDARLTVFGQDYNSQAYAICGSDMLIKGHDIDNIRFGDSFTDDHFAGKKFDYMLANPPFGVKWEAQQDFITREHEEQGFGGRFGAGLPRINDGSLLFLLHMISKMKDPKDGGTRLAIVFNGSPLFTGSAGSGESEIRRWIIENDWLEGIVALPDQLFYNTGIYTYLWIVTNRKDRKRRGKVQLVNAASFFKKMRKSLGNKRHEICEPQRDEITRLYGDFKEGEHVRIFDNEDFGYRRITVERPLRLNFAVTDERLAALQADSAFQALAESKKRKDKKAAEVEAAAGRKQQEAILTALKRLADTGVVKNREAFAEKVKAAFKETGVKVPAALFDNILLALAERDETAEVCKDAKGNPEPDPELRDYENVPLKEDVAAYMAREVLPHVPDAWVDESKTKVGYEIGLNRYFYKYTPPRPLHEIERELKQIEREIAEILHEKRAALISHAVTKGLDPKAPMKGSGIEWLGEIPVHWDARRLRFLVSEPLKYGANVPAELDDPTMPRYIRITDVDEHGRLREETFKSIPEEVARPYLLRDGDLLFARSGATVGKSFYYEPSWGRAAYAGYLIRARFNPARVMARFVMYFTNSSHYWQWLNSSFIQATIENVSAEKYANLPVPLPPIDEQRSIAAFLDRETARIDALVGKINLSIDRLREYRTALISAAVTGKIDVRQEVA